MTWALQKGKIGFFFHMLVSFSRKRSDFVVVLRLDR